MPKSASNLSLRYQPFAGLYGAVVLLAEPEAEACALYSRHFEDARMQVIKCDQLSKLLRQIEQVQPDVVVFNPAAHLSQSVRMMGDLRKLYPSLPVVTICETLPEGHLDAIMNTGVSVHLNRRFSRPRDLLVTIEQILS